MTWTSPSPARRENPSDDELGLSTARFAWDKWGMRNSSSGGYVRAEQLAAARAVLQELIDLHGLHLQVLLRSPGHEQMALEYAERHPRALARAVDVLGA
jgi:hypothetical protein